MQPTELYSELQNKAHQEMEGYSIQIQARDLRTILLFSISMHYNTTRPANNQHTNEAYFSYICH